MIPIGILTPNGLIDAPYSASSLAEAATKEPQGVYTLGRTFKRDHVLMLDDHLDRLEQSAVLEHIPLHLDRAALRRALRSLIDRSGYPDSRYRITIPRETPDQPLISLEPYRPVPPEVLAHGAKVITVHKERQNPAAKTTAWMAQRRSTVEGFPPGIYEAILVSADGKLLEGTSSNYYAILGGILRTAEEGVLSGIARRALLQIAPAIVPVDLRPVTIAQIGALQEALLTSAGRGVVPIVMIDGQAIGDGQPGPITRCLQDAYDDWANAHLEKL
ncbi:MAG TPA: aminotransferase class IV [Aggregatilineales bacterium]|nr:aminotransferase class IV [Aggregatilineales bacterium]